MSPIDHDELTETMSLLACRETAASWRPGGALPWDWAARGIASLVAEAIGPARADVDVEQVALTAAASEPISRDDVELGDPVDEVAA